MTKPQRRLLTVIGTVNLFLGTLTFISAVFNFLFYLLQAVEDLPQSLLDGSLLLVAGLFGFTSGWALLKRRRGARLLSAGFAVSLAAIVGVLIVEGRFEARMPLVIAVYSALLLALCAMPVWNTVSAPGGSASSSAGG